MKAATQSVGASLAPVNQELFASPKVQSHRRARRSHLQKVCDEFVIGLLAGQSSKSQCYIVSTSLAGFLGFFERLECEPVEGFVGEEHHWWLSLADGQIIDGTADQFNGNGNPEMPLVYIGEMPGWYRLVEEGAK